MTEMDFEFDLGGRLVKPGQILHVSPSYHMQAGASAKVERYHGDTVTLRTDNGAVPTVPITALSWEPQPETVAKEELQQAGFFRPTNRDVAVWIAARKATALN